MLRTAKATARSSTRRVARPHSLPRPLLQVSAWLTRTTSLSVGFVGQIWRLLFPGRGASYGKCALLRFRVFPRSPLSFSQRFTRRFFRVGSLVSHVWECIWALKRIKKERKRKARSFHVLEDVACALSPYRFFIFFLFVQFDDNQVSGVRTTLRDSLSRWRNRCLCRFRSLIVRQFQGPGKCTLRSCVACIASNNARYLAFLRGREASTFFFS